MSFLKANPQILYQTDYLKWLETNLEKLRNQNYADVDWENLLEEIEDMGRSEQRRLESNLIVVLLHLLKWQYQPTHRSGSWERSIIAHRRRIRKAINESPSLQAYLESILDEGYQEAVKQVLAETGLPFNTFLPSCCYDLTNVISDDFLP